jgi:hypothetical protein
MKEVIIPKEELPTMQLAGKTYFQTSNWQCIKCMAPVHIQKIDNGERYKVTMCDC